MGRLLMGLVIIWLVLAPNHGAVCWGQCGAKGDWRSALIPDQWPPVGLRRGGLAGGGLVRVVKVSRACRAHDQCYDTPGMTRDRCDRRFKADMRAECARTYQSPLDAAMRQACYTAAEGYYEAVVKFGGPAFAAAQKRAAGRMAGRASADSSARPASGASRKQPRAKPTRTKPRSKYKWRKLGLAKEGGIMAATSRRIFLYLPGSNEVWASWADYLKWEKLGAGPPSEERAVLAAGSGKLFLWDPATGRIWSSPCLKMKWREIGHADGVGSLAVAGSKLYAFNPRTQQIMVSKMRPVQWKPLTSLKAASGITADGGRLIVYSHATGSIMAAKPARLDWRPMGPTLQGHSLAVFNGRFYMLNEDNLEVWEARRR